MIILHDLYYKYPQSDFSLAFDRLEIKKGAKTAFIGPSGFGKTTLLNLLAGILLPQKGRITINDTVVNQLSDTDRRNYRIRNIGFVFQDFRLLEYLSVMDNILLPCRINKTLALTDELRSAATAIARELRIDSKLSRYPAKLSHGERQRVAICRALLHEPDLILADEPTGNLDPANKSHIMAILYKYVDERGSTLITVTHDHEMLAGFDAVVDFQELTGV